MKQFFSTASSLGDRAEAAPQGSSEGACMQLKQPTTTTTTLFWRVSSSAWRCCSRPFVRPRALPSCKPNASGSWRRRRLQRHRLPRRRQHSQRERRRRRQQRRNRQHRRPKMHSRRRRRRLLTRTPVRGTQPSKMCMLPLLPPLPASPCPSSRRGRLQISTTRCRSSMEARLRAHHHPCSV